MVIFFVVSYDFKFKVARTKCRFNHSNFKTIFIEKTLELDTVNHFIPLVSVWHLFWWYEVKPWKSFKNTLRQTEKRIMEFFFTSAYQKFRRFDETWLTVSFIENNPPPPRVQFFNYNFLPIMGIFCTCII